MTRALALVLVVSVAARASEQTADEIVKKADIAYSNFADMTVSAEMQIFDPGASAGRKFNFSTFLKGERRLVRFTSPDDVKGMGMLLENRETMFVYLPGFQRVRKMNTHTRGQTFMGSDFGYEDMAESTYTGYWIPKIAGTDANQWMIDLTPAPGKVAEFPRMRVWFDKVRYLATRIEFFDEKNVKARTETRGDFKRDEGPVEHWSPTLITITDHRRNDHHTTMHFVQVKVNTGLPDELFNQRGLMRGGQ